MRAPSTSPTIRPAFRGLVMALGDKWGLGADLREAIYVSGGGELVPHTPDQLKLLIDYEKVGAGLRAEAGQGGPMIIQLWSSSERLATGRRLGCWLMFSATPVGDAVYWLVSIMDGTDTALQFARRHDAETAMEMLRSAASGASSEYDARPSPIYTEADLEDIRQH